MRRDPALAENPPVDRYLGIGFGGSVMTSSFSPNSWHIASVEELMALAEAQDGEPQHATIIWPRVWTASAVRRRRRCSGNWPAWSGSTPRHCPTGPARRPRKGALPDDLGEGTATDSDEIPASLTPYRALAIAVRNEERAFSLLTYVAANAENTDVGRVPKHWLLRNFSMWRCCALSAARRSTPSVMTGAIGARHRDRDAVHCRPAGRRREIAFRRAEDPSGHCARTAECWRPGCVEASVPAYRRRGG